MGRTQVRRLIAATPRAVYEAMLDPAAVERWKVPDGMSSVVHCFQARVGGRFRVSLTYTDGGEGKTSARTDTYHGRFLELVPETLIVEAVEFETRREELGGVMTIRTALAPAGAGTEVLIDHAGLPQGVREADNRLGTEMALAKLAALLEADGAAQ